MKDIFKQGAKTEILQLTFGPDKLAFKGMTNKKFGYEIKSSSLSQYGIYLSRESTELSPNYAIKVPLKYILGCLKVGELIEGDLHCAMECIDSTNAICFFFTKGRDFTFNIGVNNVMFENLEGESGGQIAGVQQREIKAPKKQEATVPDVDTMMETETAVVEKVDNMKIEPPKDEPLTEVKESASVKKSVV